MAENKRGFEQSGSSNMQKASTNSLVTPPIDNPPLTIGLMEQSQKRQTDRGRDNEGGPRSRAASALDATALEKALRDVGESGRQRDHTPSNSPSRKRQRIYGDR